MALHTRSVVRALLLAAALAPLQSCRDGGPAAPCDSNVVMTVSAGLSPTFHWTPACTIGYLAVERLESDGHSSVWMTFDDHNSIRPGIQYGSRSENPAVPLQPGADYRIRIGTFMGAGGFDLVATIVGTFAFSR